MVELKNVSVTYSSGVDALNNVNLRINDGDFAFVVGSSGAGKSTMIKLLLKEIDATSGSVIVNGYNLNKLRKRKIPEFRRTLGFVFQDFRLIPSMTVYENIAFVLRVIDATNKEIKKRVPYVIDLVGLHDKMNSYPDELSGGEKQRVAIARALVNDPQLIIADEPTGNIDPELSYEIVELLKGINDQGTTILMVTHEHDLVRHFGGRIINIADGEIAYDNVISGMGELPEEIAEIDDTAGEFPVETMIDTFTEEENDNSQTEIQSEEAAEEEPVMNTEEALPFELDDMSPEDIISAITEDSETAAEPAEEKTASAETADEIREQAQAILEQAEKKLAEVSAIHEAEAIQTARLIKQTEQNIDKIKEENEAAASETASETFPVAETVNDTASAAAEKSPKKRKRKKHKKSAETASEKNEGGADK